MTRLEVGHDDGGTTAPDRSPGARGGRTMSGGSDAPRAVPADEGTGEGGEVGRRARDDRGHGRRGGQAGELGDEDTAGGAARVLSGRVRREPGFGGQGAGGLRGVPEREAGCGDRREGVLEEDGSGVCSGAEGDRVAGAVDLAGLCELPAAGVETGTGHRGVGRRAGEVADVRLGERGVGLGDYGRPAGRVRGEVLEGARPGGRPHVPPRDSRSGWRLRMRTSSRARRGGA